MPSWACSSHFYPLHPGSSTSYDRHLCFRALLDLPTGGRQHSTCHSRTLHPSTPGEWSHRHPVPPSRLAVRRDHPSGAQWAPWASRLSSYPPQRHPLANHTTARARTRQVRTTARPRHLHRFLLCLYQACWPSSAGQAPCTTAMAASDGTRASHHSTPPSPKWTRPISCT